MKLIRWIIAFVVLFAWAALIGTALYVAMYEPWDEVPKADAIVVLGSEAGGAAGVTGQTKERLDRAVALYEAGTAPVLVMSGGAVGGDATPVAEEMRDAAVAAGVPAEAILVEGASHSTLQDALFTADIESLDKAAPIILVSHRYHLPRAWASFRWAGFQNVTRVAADETGGFQISESLLWETLKWPLNAARAAAASAAMAGDVPRENFLKYLE